MPVSHVDGPVPAQNGPDSVRSEAESRSGYRADDGKRRGWGEMAVAFLAGAIVAPIVVAVISPYVSTWVSSIWGDPTVEQVVVDSACDVNLPPPAVGEHEFYVLVSPHGEDCWSRTMALGNATSFDVAAVYRSSSSQQDNVSFRAFLPTGTDLVAHSTKWFNAAHPTGLSVSDSDALVSEAGINVGSYVDGGNAWVRFEVKLTPEWQGDCGVGLVTPSVTLYADPEGVWSGWQTAGVVTFREC